MLSEDLSYIQLGVDQYGDTVRIYPPRERPGTSDQWHPDWDDVADETNCEEVEGRLDTSSVCAVAG
eukprot:4791720-Amphidinium_carterae.1